MKQNSASPVVPGHTCLVVPVGAKLTSRPSILNSLSGHSAAATDQPSTLAPSTNPPIHQSIDPGLINPGLRLGVALLLLLALAGFSVRGAEPQTLHGHVPPALQSLTPTGRLPGTNRLNLAIGLPLRNAASLSNLLQQIYDPASPQYHHYLTPAEFTSRFGPTEEDYQAVIAFARANHLRVTTTHPNRLLLDVSGSVAEVEQALHLTLHTYRHPTENRTFYAPDREPSLDMSVPVLHISGLDNYVLPRPASHKMTFPTPNATPATGSGPSGSYMGKDFRAAYVPGVSLTGAGQSVGLLQFDSGFEQSNITSYETQAGLPSVPVQAVLLDGYGGGPGEANDEVSLDIEMVISMAPGVSQIDVFEGEITDDILNAMAASNQVRQLSASWSYPIDATTVQIFQQFAAQGQSFFNASGDYDAWVGSIYPPCDNPYITIVGGTTLTMNGTGGSYESETAWNRDNGIGTGGGISTEYPIPSWQTNISMAANQGSTTMRNIPDVAMTAEDVWVICANGGTGAYGGTSCATPLWAGFAALVNQQAASTGQPPIGFINPAVYAIGTGPNYAACFHDTTTGNNTSVSSPTKFYAVAGYDLCTGWGTPAGQNLINALANPEPLLITPTSGFSAIGGVGGPFFPVTSQNYSLTNSGTNALTWSLSNTSAWLNVSSSGGTLAPGGPASLVTVSLNNAASNLVVGNYGSTIWITNQNDQIGQSRQFALSIISPPGITQQPANQAVLEGATAAFSVQATGGLPLVYQWQCNGTNLMEGGNIYGSASTNLTISDVSAANIGSYTLVVTNFAGTATSSNAELTIVPSPPVIITQPASQTAFDGESVQLMVAVIGTTPYSYQWSLNTTNLIGATNATLMLSDVQASQSGNNYSVLVTNVYGATNSAIATLTVLPCDPPPSGLVSWWRAEGNADDSIGGNNGTIMNGAGFTNGEVGQSFNFPLVSNPYSRPTNGAYVQVPYNSLWAFGTNSFTIELWVNFNSFLNSDKGDPLGGLMIGEDQGGGGLNKWFFAWAGGVLEFHINGPTINGGAGVFLVQAPFAPVLDQWYHLALTRSGNLYTIYTNGVAAGSQTDSNAIPDPGVPLTIGQAEGFYFNGQLDEVSIYNRALSALEIQPIYMAGSGGKCFNPVSPTITTQPTNQTVALGSTVTFSVVASGTLPMNYQWSFNNTNLAGATNAALTLADVQPANGGVYAVTASNAYGSAVSSNALLTVLVFPPAITMQPTNQTVSAGSAATFTVAASGTPPLSYQWSFDSNGITGATNAALTLANVQPTNGGVYAVTVSNAYGEVVSSNAVLTVQTYPPTITAQPQSQTNLLGGAATFTVTATGTAPLNYQWDFKTANLVGATNATLTLTNVQMTEAGSYSVLVSNAYGATNSATAVLTVNPALPCDPPPSGLVDWWRAEGNATDSIGTNNGTMVNGAGFTNGEVGQAFNFPLVSNPYSRPTNGAYVQVPYNSVWAFGTNSFAIELWANFNSFLNSDKGDPLGGLMIGEDHVSTGTKWFFALGGGVLEFHINGPTINGGAGVFLVQAAFAPVLNQWYHLAVTRNGNLYTIYTNGVAAGSQTDTNVIPDPGVPLTIGQAEGYYFNGQLDEVSIYNRALSSNEIAAIYSAGDTGKCIGPVSPSITQQPQGQTNFVGSVATFIVTAAGTPPLSYQWNWNGTNIAGATNATLTLINVQPTNCGLYTVTVSNPYGAILSSNAVLTLLTQPPVILTQPISQTNFVGTTASFNVTAGGTPPLRYQWNMNATEILGATNATLTLTNVQMAQAGNYSVLVSNLYGATNSAMAVLTVNPTLPCDPPPSGLVDWWRAEGNATDSIGTNNGSMINGAGFTNGEVGQAFNFPLVGNPYSLPTNGAYVQVPYNSLFAFGTNSFTIELWANFNSFLNSDKGDPLGGLMIGEDHVSTGTKWFFALGGGVLEFHINGPTINGGAGVFLVQAAFAPVLNQWYHLAVTRNGNLYTIYTNGVAAGSQTDTNVIPDPGVPLTIGQAEGFYFNGQLDEVSIYQRALSAAEIQAIYVAGSGGKCVPTAPFLVAQPTNQAVAVGGTATFTVVAGGTTPLSYQWSFNGTNLTGATNFVLTLANVQLINAGNYSVSVSNLLGSVTSSNALLTILTSPVIIQPPANNTNVAGSTASFAASANGSAPLIYQWQKNGVPLNNGGKVSGATTTGLTLTNVQDADAAIYALVVTNVAGGVTSAPAMLVVLDPPAITLQPTNQFVQARSNAVLVAAATGTAPLGCQWSCNGTNLWNTQRITGSQGSVLVISNAMVRDSGNYQVVFTNSLGSATSSVAVLTVGLPPQITSEPASHSAPLGCTVSFSVGAAGSQPLAEQWWKDGSLLNTQTNATLTVSNFQSADLGSYSVVVTNGFGSVTSSPAVLSVGYHPPVAGPDVVQRFAAGGVRISTADLLANDVDTNGDSLTIIGVSSYSASGGSVGLANNWVYYAPPAGWTNSDSFTYTVSDGLCETDEGTVLVEVTADNPQPAHFGIGAQANGPMQLSFTGIPGSQYQIQYADSLVNPNWQVLTTQPADGFGVCQFTDWSPTNTTIRYYRAVQVLTIPFGSR